MPADGASTLERIDAGARNCARWPLTVQRHEHLRSLVLAVRGSGAALNAIAGQLADMHQLALGGAERQGRIDGALAAIAARNAELARTLIEPLIGRADTSSRRWNFELSYCQAKLCELTGRSGESLKHYQRYALESVLCLRTESASDAMVSKPNAMASASSSVKDDVEMSLPAKYRRAYRYLLGHLDSAGLSVREIAEHIGVTERALQSAFRTHLGMSPAEVLRRCRVERIRKDLLNEDAPGGTIIEAAARWGISNRSTLVSCYRRYYRETPAETLMRRGQHPVAAGVFMQA
jgi:AraC-like DNA-binding protein